MSEVTTATGVSTIDATPIPFTADHARKIDETHAALTKLAAAFDELMPAIQSNPMLQSLFGIRSR